MNLKEFNPRSSKYEEIATGDEGETLITMHPNSSKAWVLYMVWHLKQAEISKARATASRALQTINFREDKEKLNVWKALLNLENRFGTPESLNNVLKEALLYMDQLTIYKHMLDIYMSTGKSEELEQLSKTVLKKFKTDRDVWLILGNYYMMNNKLDVARSILARSLQCLSNKDHPEMLGKFAYLEYKHGSLEKSLSMFEEILVKYPKRKDLKSIYIEVLKSQGQDERIKSLL